MNKYQLLINVLDSIVSEASNSCDRNIYNVTNEEQANQARARALIHLFLRTRFWLTNCVDAEKYITEGSWDGWLDWYYIDKESKSIFLIQSKFRTNERNFEEMPVNGYDLFSMHLGAITRGEIQSPTGEAFNWKILGFQRWIQEISNIGQYKYILIFLGNISRSINSNTLNSVSGNVCSEVEIINWTDTYNKLLLPYLQSDFYHKKDFVLKIQVNQNQSNRINYAVNVNGQSVNINLSFIPTIEIAKMMNEYKNSLLKYNPRCYVWIKNGGVNQKIRDSISQTNSNEFSLLNNWITIICSDFEYSERNALAGIATLLVTNPQIVNGGQTAFTLAKIYQEGDNSIFENKEVLVKFISLNEEQTPEQINLIEKISEATNNQTPVGLSDRKSNDINLVRLQNYLFETHGFILERKKGEFFEAISKNIISKDNIISKEDIMRLAFVISWKVSEARSYSNDKLFKQYPLSTTDFEDLFKCILIYRLVISQIQSTRNQNERFRVSVFWYGLKYGKFALAWIIFNLSKNSNETIETILETTKNLWLNFEETIAQKPLNGIYSGDWFNYDNYYKGKTINDDLIEYLNSIQ